MIITLQVNEFEHIIIFGKTWIIDARVNWVFGKITNKPDTGYR